MPPHLAFLLTTAISLGRSVRPAAGKVALTIDAIMARVAANQNQSEELQKQYLCKEHIHVVTRKPGGRVMREETADYEIALMGTGTQKQLKALTGRYWHKGKYEDFNGEPVPWSRELGCRLHPRPSYVPDRRIPMHRRCPLISAHSRRAK